MDTNFKKRNYYIYMVSNDSIKKVFGFNLRRLRKMKSLTQEVLAENIGLDYKTISGIETGKTFVSGDVIAKLCNYFNVEPDFFFKTKYSEPTEKEVDLKREINRLLADCSYETMQSIYNVIIALKK